jgi:hypothetical protein
MRRIVLAVLLTAIGACGSPAGPSGGGGGAATSGATITLTDTGGGNATINSGQGVTFVNQSSRSISINSDPHPDHTDCPGLNAVGSLSPGQTKVSGALTRQCGFHDHNNPTDGRAMGTIQIR